MVMQTPDPALRPTNPEHPLRTSLWPLAGTLLGLAASTASSQIWTATLLPNSTYQATSCPPQRPVPLRGTCRVRLLSIGNVSDFYAIEDIHWAAELSTGPIRIVGEGDYRANNFPTPNPFQFISLSLASDGGAPVRFWSASDDRPRLLPDVAGTIRPDSNIGCDWPTLTIHLAPTCRADMDGHSSGAGVPDGGVSIEDLLFFLRMYADGDLRADVDNGTGTQTPDGGVSAEDLLYFLSRFASGC